MRRQGAFTTMLITVLLILVLAVNYIRVREFQKATGVSLIKAMFILK